MNIVLCGMMGVGKSSVGIQISKMTGRRWYDTDIMITDRHGRISDIFEYYGEAYFRNLETDIVSELSNKDGLVISTGGGLVLKPENSKMLKENGKIFFLRASYETLMKRIYVDDSRPLLRDTDQMAERVGELLRARTPIYSAVADYVIETDDKSVLEVAQEIIVLMEKEQ